MAQQYEYACINCTVVELKRCTVIYIYSYCTCINCTVVELKQRTNTSDNRAIVVLIVPLWN